MPVKLVRMRKLKEQRVLIESLLQAASCKSLVKRRIRRSNQESESEVRNQNLTEVP